MNKKHVRSVSDYDWQEIIYYRKLSPKEKLDYLEKMARFIYKITPEKSRIRAQNLRKLGF